MARERRLTFGTVAESYERFRPEYPAAVVDDVLAHTGAGSGSEVLEVGAGTGKATRAFLARGLRLVCLEPDRDMASVLRRRCPDAEVVDVGLERYDAGARRFDLLLSAQAWHWVEPAARREAPPRLLRPGGAVALLWNDYGFGEALHDRVDELYRRLAPELLDDDMAPRRSAEEEPTGDELEAAGLLDVTYRRYDLAGEVEADEFVGALATTSRYLLLPEDRRSEVLGAIRDLLLETGEPVRFPSGTDLWLARAPR